MFQQPAAAKTAPMTMRNQPLESHRRTKGRRPRRYRKARSMRGFSFIGAPRFELGTSSPPDCFGRLAARAATWREVACCLALRPIRVPEHRMALSSGFQAFGH
jgi:hypothetical protein